MATNVTPQKGYRPKLSQGQVDQRWMTSVIILYFKHTTMTKIISINFQCLHNYLKFLLFVFNIVVSGAQSPNLSYFPDSEKKRTYIPLLEKVLIPSFKVIF